MRYIYVLYFSFCADRDAPFCEHNPEELVCSCKGFRHVGICSHVLVINDWLDSIDVTGLLTDLSGGRVGKQRTFGNAGGGYMKGVRPALTKEDPTQKKLTKKKPTQKRLAHARAAK